MQLPKSLCSSNPNSTGRSSPMSFVARRASSILFEGRFVGSAELVADLPVGVVSPGTLQERQKLAKRG